MPRNLVCGNMELLIRSLSLETGSGPSSLRASRYIRFDHFCWINDPVELLLRDEAEL